MTKKIRKMNCTSTIKYMEKLIQQINHSKSHFASVKTSYFSTKTLKYILNLVAYIHGHYENLSCLYQTPMNEESNTFTS